MITTRKSIENKKLILNRNVYAIQQATREYNSRKLLSEKW